MGSETGGETYVVRREVETYLVVNRKQWHRCYVIFDGDGTVLVSSPSHDYYGTHCWPERHRAEPNLVKFLSECDRQYLCKKLFADRYKEFDYEKTMSKIRRGIIGNRRCGNYSAKEARTYWDELDDIEAEGTCSPESIYDMSTMDCIYEDFVYEDSASIRAFWDDIWVPFIGNLLKAPDAD